MAIRKGFEPLTYGLGNRCSILLSYRVVSEPFTVPIRYLVKIGEANVYYRIAFLFMACLCIKLSYDFLYLPSRLNA
jgi:hypothetical protein